MFKDEQNLIIQKSDDDSGSVISFGILSENIYQSEINEYVKNQYILYPQIFVFDNKSKNYISSISTRFVFNTKITSQNMKDNAGRIFDAYRSMILDSKIKHTFKGRCVNNEVKVSFLEIYEILWDCLDIRSVDRFNLKIRNIDFGDSDYAKFSFLKNKNSNEAAKYKLANIATAATSHLTFTDQFLVLPHSKEQSVATVQNRFAKTSNINVSLPEPDFVIDIKIKGTKSKVLKEDEDEANLMYAIGINYKILEPYSGTLIFDGDFKHFKPIKKPKSLKTNKINHSEQNDFFFYNLLFEELISQISKNILREKLDKNNKEWIGFHSNNKDELKKILKLHDNIKKTFFK